MFLTLPRDLQEAIFDLLSPRDRIRLNCAIPKDSEIVKTTLTDKAVTKQLGVISYFIEKTNPNKLSSVTNVFLMANARDPEALVVLRSVYPDSALINSWYPDANLKCPVMIHVEQLKKELLSGNVTDGSFEVFKMLLVGQDEVNPACKEIVDTITCANPETFDKLVANEHANNFIKRFWFNIHENMFFGLINTNREPLLRYITGNLDFWPDVDWHSRMEYVRSDTIVKIFADGGRVDAIKMIIEYISLPYVSQQRALRIAIENMKMPLAEYLFRIRFKL